MRKPENQYYGDESRLRLFLKSKLGTPSVYLSICSHFCLEHSFARRWIAMYSLTSEGLTEPRLVLHPAAMATTPKSSSVMPAHTVVSPEPVHHAHPEPVPGREAKSVTPAHTTTSRSSGTAIGHASHYIVHAIPYNPQTVPAAWQKAMEAMKTLNIKMHPATYLERYGEPRLGAPYGVNVWQGLKRDLFEWLATPSKGSPSGFQHRLVPGWFTAPAQFSKSEATRAQEEVNGPTYPGLFIVDIPGGFILMWCQRILIYRSPGWWVHPTRVQLLPDFAGYFRFADAFGDMI